LSTIIESPALDKAKIKRKATNESKSIRVMSSGTPDSEEKKPKGKFVLKKSMIKEMERKMIKAKNTEK